MLRLLGALAVLACVLALSACGGSSGSSGKRTTGKAKTAAGTTKPAPRKTVEPKPKPPAVARCRKVARPAPRTVKLAPPTKRLDAKRHNRVILMTSCGTITIELAVEQAPKTTASFASLARRGFYDRSAFDRVVAGFVIQAGDPSGTGVGGPSYKVVEPPPASTRYTQGVVAMAKGQIEDPGTSGSQFFIVIGPDANLPPEYALVGRVVTGMNVASAIGVLPVDQSNPDPRRQEAPISPAVIERARFVVTR